MSQSNIAADFRYESHYVTVLGSKIHYIEQGKGDPILFLHGVPGSNYLWRNVIPHLSTLGRCIAPDLIGFGKSAKPDIEYSVETHIEYLEKFIEALGLKKILLVLHGWGSIIGFDYAMKHESNCKGIVFYEAFLRSLNGDDVSLPLQEQLSLLTAQEQNMNQAVNGVQFVDQLLPQAMMRSLTERELNFYREPFLTNESYKPMQSYCHALAKPEGKKEVDAVIKSYSEKLSRSTIPKLMLYSIPGFITTIATVIWAKEHIPNLEIVEVGEEYHYAQESNPFLMGESMSIWLQGVEQSS